MDIEIDLISAEVASRRVALALFELRTWEQAFYFHVLNIAGHEYDHALLSITYRGDWPDNRMVHLWLLDGLIDFEIGEAAFEIGVFQSKWGFRFLWKDRRFQPLY